MCRKINIAKTKVLVVDNTTIHVNNVLIENVEGYVTHTWDNTTASRKRTRQRDTAKNHGRRSSTCQTPGYLQKQSCHLPEETGIQLLCAASYDIWCRDLDTDQTSTEQLTAAQTKM